ncbi:MAG: transcription antitermination protein NusB [Alphaproteobacteria bacterium]|jgi:N utilization substance protein B|nr:transcription antitermination protein NusB [Alphaproteobacteria bacterium]MCB1551036.1 transcription antitermination protein NusB [Alphaproteobacteria bacterium]MCB9984605.1 transcription antitermination protein NusB [Micavibrio sp.]HPQ50447.1 transcription antitermination factor NusB [Alphaproteobacteria bacterium]HRK97948.1 transcription antitermination factor NusB [Alphaproteobacteria bacterium]
MSEVNEVNIEVKHRNKGSLKARKTAARLLAVQVVYQGLQNKVSPSSLYDEYMTHRRGMDLDDGFMVEPDVPLFQGLISGITDRWGDIQQIIQPRVQEIGDVQNLLASVLICGAYELLAHNDIDTPIIISDYLDITVGFFSGNEPKLVNGILDAVAKELRNF